MKSLLIAAAALLAVLSAAPVQAATIYRNSEANDHFIHVDGKIVPGDLARFKAALATTMGKTFVVLSSNGGDMIEAMMIGEIVRERQMVTVVLAEKVCASACALMWLSGAERMVAPKAAIGFHAAANTATGKESGAGSAMMGAYLWNLGYGYRAIEWVASAAPDEMVWLQPKAAELGITFWVMK